MNSPEKNKRYRTFVAYQSFDQADEELRRYWHSRTPEERMAALEELRVAVYGEAAINAPVQGVFGVVARHN